MLSTAHSTTCGLFPKSNWARRPLIRPKVFYMGPKQSPGIFQAFMDSNFSKLRGPEGEELFAIFMEDLFISLQPKKATSTTKHDSLLRAILTCTPMRGSCLRKCRPMMLHC